MACAILKYKSLIKLTSSNLGLKHIRRLDLNSTTSRAYLTNGNTCQNVQNVKPIEILKDNSTTSHAVYFSKLNSLFDELKRNLAEFNWAKESDLNLNESKIDQIIKFNQHNPKLASIINKIKSTRDFNKIINYFDSTLNELDLSELSILFRVLNLIDNRPKENQLILKIEKLFYSLIQPLEQQHSFDNKTAEPEDQANIKNDGSIDRARKFHLQDLINFNHGFYNLRYKSNYSVDLMHFYSTSTQPFYRLLNDSINNLSIMENDEQVKQILDGLSCYGYHMSQEALIASLLATLKFCKTQKNIAFVQNLAISNKILSQKLKQKMETTTEKIFLVNDKNHFEEWMFSHKYFIQAYFSFVFGRKKQDKQKKEIEKDIKSILELFINSNNISDASNILNFMLHLQTYNKYKENFNNAMKMFEYEKNLVNAKIIDMISKSDFSSLFKIFVIRNSFNNRFYKNIGIDVFKLKEVVEILKNSAMVDEKLVELIFHISFCFPQIFDPSIANELYNKSSKYFVLYSLINQDYFHENSAIILDALENIRKSYSIYEICFMTQIWPDMFENADRRIQVRNSTNIIRKELIDFFLPEASMRLLYRNYKSHEFEIQSDSKNEDKINFKFYKINYRYRLISKILNNILNMNQNYFNTKIDLNLNEFNEITDNYVGMFNFLKANYNENESHLNDPEYLQVNFEFGKFAHHIGYLSILQLLIKCTKKMDPLFALQLLEIFNKVSNILLDPFFKQLTSLRYKSYDYRIHIFMLFESLSLFNIVDIDDIRNNLVDKNKFDVLLKQTHKNLDCLVKNVKLDSQNLEKINSLFLNMNHLNENFIVNSFSIYKEVSYIYFQ